MGECGRAVRQVKIGWQVKVRQVLWNAAVESFQLDCNIFDVQKTKSIRCPKHQCCYDNKVQDKDKGTLAPFKYDRKIHFYSSVQFENAVVSCPLVIFLFYFILCLILLCSALENPVCSNVSYRSSGLDWVELRWRYASCPVNKHLCSTTAMVRSAEMCTISQ